MRKITENLQFTTEAFIAGKDQNMPEIRAASMRGLLHWWFRILGGTVEQEKELFGSVLEYATASKIIVRVSKCNVLNNLEEVKVQQNTGRGYLLHFAKESGREDGISRTGPGHYIGIGSTFTLEIIERHPVAEDQWALLKDAVEAICFVGSLGLRATRGCGMLARQMPPTAQAFEDWVQDMKQRYPTVLTFFKAKTVESDSWKSVHGGLGNTLRDLRKSTDPTERLSPKEPSAAALGTSSGNERVTSCLHLCPVKTSDQNVLPILFYTDCACHAPSVLHIIKRRRDLLLEL